MKYLELTFPAAEANLACDEVLLDWCESDNGADEVLRVWEASFPFVVVGYANQIAREVHLGQCSERGIPVLRRCSGGGAVVQGQGCLNYAVILQIDRVAQLASIPGTNRWVMERHRHVFSALLQREVRVRGHTDLAIDERKFSGNSQRRKRRFLLFHGTFLLHFDLPLISELLPIPSKEPTYRARRGHSDFMANLGIAADVVKRALREAWQASEALVDWPSQAVAQLAKDKYSCPDWNTRF